MQRAFTQERQPGDELLGLGEAGGLGPGGKRADIDQRRQGGDTAIGLGYLAKLVLQVDEGHLEIALGDRLAGDRPDDGRRIEGIFLCDSPATCSGNRQNEGHSTDHAKAAAG